MKGFGSIIAAGVMSQAASLLVMAQETAKTSTKAEIGDVSPTAIAYNQLKFWLLIVFLVLAMIFSWQIVVDNEPDTQKDSILYSKFLTRKVDSGKIE
mmetsp:Transcript_11076/g.18548  ORF Transcript_11076/g.18548 Transcript_11076/m.18548 type:complete len:97 (-) Transcript_11076:49-339(-)|eukprot:CAMPEP_0168608900 /NCGR_PEP_ID=MMETSP0449_2-20121227/900_1 /TAXON_ID=1082188 /ORGANISM="Strombidium rassoulzadegani, Strain ras09" /LENGTH=96 /DNA_ID=CAMNT_0008648969 /DNA_START=50 /DNA_END=340 /DNA_ORIENTATION=-